MGRVRGDRLPESNGRHVTRDSWEYALGSDHRLLVRSLATGVALEQRVREDVWARQADEVSNLKKLLFSSHKTKRMQFEEGV